MHTAIERIRRKGYNTDRALIPTVSSFPPLDSCPPSAMHYKRQIMTVTAPQVCSMLDLLFSSQAFLSLPLTTCTGTHTHMRTRTHIHTSRSALKNTHTHTNTYSSQLLCQRDSGARAKGILHESASHNCCIHSAMIQTCNLNWAFIVWFIFS